MSMQQGARRGTTREGGADMGGTGKTVCSWRVDWTEDGREWHARGFHTLDAAREHGVRLMADNEANPEFAIFAERMMQVNTSDFLDYGLSAGRVRLAPHLLGTAGAFG